MNEFTDSNQTASSQMEIYIGSSLSCSVFWMCGQSEDGKQEIAIKDVPI